MLLDNTHEELIKFVEVHRKMRCTTNVEKDANKQHDAEIAARVLISLPAEENRSDEE